MSGAAPAEVVSAALPVLRLCAWLVLLSAIFVPVERLFALRPARVFRMSVATDLGFYFLSSLVPAAAIAAPLAMLVSAAHAVMPAAVTGAVAALPFWAKLVASVAIGELGFYWGHRWSHEVPLLWRFHAVHHAPEHLDWLVNTRVHPVDMIVTRLCGLAPLTVLGLGAPAAGGATLIPMLVLVAGTVWGFFIHANVGWRFGPLEQVIATPAFHHWHHSNDGPAVINRNYAPLLPLVDRLFGTLHLPARRTPQRYGIDEAMPAGLVAQLWHPLRLPKRRQVEPAPGSQASSGASTAGQT